MLGRGVFLLAVVEYLRLRHGPKKTLRICRAIGQRQRSMSPSRSASMRKVIRALDRLSPGGPNCYRRVLLETCLDASAAAEKVVFGFRQEGGDTGGELKDGDFKGHAWFAGRPDAGASAFEVTISL